MNFNSPIGYSKNPLPVTNVSFLEGDSSAGSEEVSNYVHHAREPKMTKFTILSLPLEIIVQITNYLDQFGIIALMKVNTQLYHTVRPQLYHTIVIEPKWSAFMKEFTLGVTYIKSSYNIKHLIQTDGKLIHRLIIKGLPDSLTFDSINDMMVKFCKNLQLMQLTWKPHFKLGFLDMNLLNLQTLDVDITEDIFSGNLDFTVFKNLHNLRKLSIGPYTKMTVIRDIMRYIPSHVEVLQLTKHYKDLIEPVSKKLLIRHHEDLDYDLQEINDLRYIFPTTFSLKKLSLSGLLVSSKQILSFKINFDLLTTFILKATEFNFGGDSFIKELKFNNLTNLAIDYRQGYQDFVPAFLANHRTITKLDLVIRINDTFPFKEENYKIINDLPLNTLSLEINQEKNLNWISQPIRLSRLNFLRGLQLQCCRFNASNEETLEFIKHQPQLKLLEVFGLNAGGSPHFALSVLHPNVYDEWFKIQHVALIYFKICPIDYIKLNHWIFERKSQKNSIEDSVIVEPRDGLEEWFDNRVRVL